MPPRLRLVLHWGVPWAAGLVTVGAVVLAVVMTGAFNTTASTLHSRPIAWAMHATMIHSVRREAGKLPPPPQFTTADVLAGAKLYDANCAACHGGPGIARAPWIGGMTPAPPFLLDAAQQFTPNELYWIVRHGVKMTGMPAWEQTLSQRDVWNLVAFLTALPHMSAAAYLRARSTDPPLVSGRPLAEGG